MRVSPFSIPLLLLILPTAPSPVDASSGSSTLLYIQDCTEAGAGAGAGAGYEHEYGYSSPLAKRKGIGGGHGDGGGGGRGSSSGHGGGDDSHPGNTRPDSDFGGTSTHGSGTRPVFASGDLRQNRPVYAGGSYIPFAAGQPSRSANKTTASQQPRPELASLADLAFWSGPVRWTGPDRSRVYRYPYTGTPIVFLNQSSGQRETFGDAFCLCAAELECSCASDIAVPPRNATVFVQSLLGNASWAALQARLQLCQISRSGLGAVLVVNGTLANGTTAASAASRPASRCFAGECTAAVMAAIGLAVSWILPLFLF